MRRAALGLALVAIASSLTARALDADTLAGAWQVTWENQSRNLLTLKAHGDRLAGSYTSDDGSSCATYGRVTARRLELHVLCPNWSIDMDGTPAADGKTVAGTYFAYGNSRGQFNMARP